jgi:two-component system, sensor histidine kinase
MQFARYRIVGNDVPAIIISGDTAPERLREAHSSGFHLLHKPVRPAKLLALLAFVLMKADPNEAG